MNHNTFSPISISCAIGLMIFWILHRHMISGETIAQVTLGAFMGAHLLIAAQAVLGPHFLQYGGVV